MEEGKRWNQDRKKKAEKVGEMHTNKEVYESRKKIEVIRRQF